MSSCTGANCHCKQYKKSSIDYKPGQYVEMCDSFFEGHISGIDKNKHPYTCENLYPQRGKSYQILSVHETVLIIALPNGNKYNASINSVKWFYQ